MRSPVPGQVIAFLQFLLQAYTFCKRKISLESTNKYPTHGKTGG